MLRRVRSCWKSLSALGPVEETRCKRWLLTGDNNSHGAAGRLQAYHQELLTNDNVKSTTDCVLLVFKSYSTDRQQLTNFSMAHAARNNVKNSELNF